MTASATTSPCYPLERVSLSATSDCLWQSGGTEPEHGVQTIKDLIEHYIPKTGFNPATDVQVLCPMTRGVVLLALVILISCYSS